MNGEVPGIPIITLAGIQSLSDVLSELPLPTPRTSSTSQSLIPDGEVAESSRRLLASRDPNLAADLAKILQETPSDDIKLKEELAGDGRFDRNMPDLLQSVLGYNPNAFGDGKTGELPLQDIKPSVSATLPQQSNVFTHQEPSETGAFSGSSSKSSSNFQQSFQNFAQSPSSSSKDNSRTAKQLDNGNTKESSKPKLNTSAEPVVVLEPLQFKQSWMKSKKSPIADHESRKKQVPAGPKPIVMLEPLDEKTLKSIQSSGTVKAGHGRRRSGDPDGYLDECNGSYRKRQRNHYADGYNDEDDSDSRSRPDTPVDYVKKKKKEKRQKRINQNALTVEELLDSPTFKKFSNCMESILESAEDINFGSLDPNDDETECPPETLISRNILSDLCGETAKLKTLGVLNQVPAERLVKLLTVLQWNIRDGTKVSPSMGQVDDDDDEEQRLWREVTMERIMRSMDSALTALYIMTAPDMPKQVYIEDVIERIIFFGKFQLQNTIFPEFDPVYRVDPKAKDGYHGSIKAKRARASQVKHKSSITLYNKISDMIGNLAELIDVQELTDTTILQVSTLGVSPFFVENISEMQLNALKLVTTVFSKYEKHRQLILEDIFASLARLPSSKRNLRNYRLNSEESIQMVTALALQLIQCVVILPDKLDLELSPGEDEEAVQSSKHKNRKRHADQDVTIITSFENALRTGHNFLSVFLKKCTTKGEEDYRPMFENFVQDLLSTVNKPEWPSSECLLSLLGRILVSQFSNKSTDMSQRVASLDYLGIVASRLRKDAVSSHDNQESLDEIIAKVTSQDSDDEEAVNTRCRKTDSPEPDTEDQTQTLQKAIVDYLAHHCQSESAYWYARQFYLAQWYRDVNCEVERTVKGGGGDADEEDNPDLTNELIQNAEKRKKFLLEQAELSIKSGANFRPPPTSLDYDHACLVARYLSSKRPFAKSFDYYLTQILRVLCETAVAVRTKAMKCLTAVIEADPGILARDDMKQGVHARFLDQSTSVREAAVELVGRFILIRPELIPTYYDMLSERILDTGISVRKRVIKIFRDICLEHAEFPKIPEICVKMIRRVNDEEGIKKLVNEVFQSMWFTPLSTREKDSSKLLTRVINITEVVAACRDTGYEFFEQLLENLLKKDEDGNYNKSAVTSCRQIVDCLVENVLTLEEKAVDADARKGCSTRLVACLSTLYLFSKIKPDLMIKHAITLQPYLDITCHNQADYQVLHYVARILEVVIPLMVHPSESFLAQVEEDMVKLVLKHGMKVIQSCVSCLGAVVNNVSHNYALVKDCFNKFFGCLLRFMAEHKSDPSSPSPARKPTLLRSLFTTGLLCRNFDFDAKEMGEAKYSVKDKVFEVLTYFMNHQDEAVKEMALSGLGSMAIRHYEYMLGQEMRDLYFSLLDNDCSSLKLKIQVLKNLQQYLSEEEVRMQKADAEWKKHAKEEDLKEMGDVQSGMASTIMQVYLTKVLESFFHSQFQVRFSALSVINLVLQQGLVHPVQCVPYLISMGTDEEQSIRVKADQQLQEIEKQYPGFIHMKALQGLKMSYRLQEILQSSSDPSSVIRGMRNPDENTISLNNYLYTVLRSNRSHRRAILTSLLNHFDDSARISLQEQVYIADNLAFFPYQTQDEPLFIIHQIDIIVSVAGSNLLQSFKEILYEKEHARIVGQGMTNGEQHIIYDEDEDNPEKVLEKLPENVTSLLNICTLWQGCILLLHVKHHLKETYGFNDSKIHNYSPSEYKAYDKPVQRKFQVKFNPETVLEVLTEKRYDVENVTDEMRETIVNDYLEFKDLMESIDPPDEDEEEEAQSMGGQTPGRHTPVPGRTTPTPGSTTPNPGRTTPTPGRHTPTPGRATPTPGRTTPTPGSKSPHSRANITPDEVGETTDICVANGGEDSAILIEDEENAAEDKTEDRRRVPPITIKTSHHHLHTPRTSRHQHLFTVDKKKVPLQTSSNRNLVKSLNTSHSSRTSSSKKHKSHKKRRKRSGSDSEEGSDYGEPEIRSSKKKPKKKRKRYGSDSDDDSDEDPDFCL